MHLKKTGLTGRPLWRYGGVAGRLDLAQQAALADLLPGEPQVYELYKIKNKAIRSTRRARSNC
jgi:hypothetical protein